jgi:tRNA(fMet)-specific endonuclease VapC
MSGRFLLDTNIIIALFRKDGGVLDKLRESREIFIPAIALGELYYGARKSMHHEENIGRIRDLASVSSVVGVNEKTAEFYGLIKQSLRDKGKPLPENDLWIASTARHHGFILVSRDEHFQSVDELSVEAW